ncbi:hypothetical protein F5888DRAFT_1639673 [Russula emetica]|nr:hypothetical protein F5888DRAFT_1639673 [Russula emetica]
MSLAWHPATPARWLMRGDGDGGDGDRGDGKVGVEEFEIEEEEVEVKVEVEVEGEVKGKKVEGKGEEVEGEVKGEEVEGEGEEVEVEGVEVEVKVKGDVVEVKGVEGEGVSEARLERTKGEKPERTREREGSRGGGRMMVVKYEIHGDNALMTNMEGVVPTLSSERGLEQRRVRWLCDAGVIIAQMTSGDQLQLLRCVRLPVNFWLCALSVGHGETDNPAKDGAETSSEAKNEVAPLRTANGETLPHSSAGIKNEKIKTRWFTVWNKTSIRKLYMLHTSVQLELGDLFINQFYSQQYQSQALQVWLLVKESDSNNLIWRQVVPNEKTFHPKLKTCVLGFQPNDTSVPTWIKPETERRLRAMPPIVLPLPVARRVPYDIYG